MILIDNKMRSKSVTASFRNCNLFTETIDLDVCSINAKTVSINGIVVLFWRSIHIIQANVHIRFMINAITNWLLRNQRVRKSIISLQYKFPNARKKVPNEFLQVTNREAILVMSNLEA